MAESPVGLHQIAEMATTLPVERIRLVEQIMATLERELAPQEKKRPRRSLYGIWAEDVAISEAEIAEVRRELWSNFPRDDVYSLGMMSNAGCCSRYPYSYLVFIG